MKIAIYTLGCKVNQYETQAMERELTGRGHTLVPFEEVADAYIVNTCTVTAVSDKKSRQMIRRARKRSPEAVVAVCGCYAQTRPEEIRELDVDLISGTGDRMKFLDLLESAVREREPVVSMDEALRRRRFEVLPAGGMAARTRAMLKVEDGCVNFCSYCIIPYARGPVRSLPLDIAAGQTRRLREEGYREIVITGIEISSWGQDLKNGRSLIDLLEAVSHEAGDMRVRLGSLEPRTITEDFCVRAAELPNLCPHFHLSMQSGCDETLRRMNRKYDTARYKKSVELLNVYFDRPAITTDLIVGFPGETEEEFSRTLDFIRSCHFAEMHIFPYSIRTGTPAAEMEQVPKAVKEERAAQAAAVAAEMRDAYLAGCVGKAYPVLYEQACDGLWHGHAPNYAAVAASGGGDLRNRVAMTRITGVENGLLLGEIERKTDKPAVRLTSHILTDAEKRAVCGWKYPGEYAVYDLPPYEVLAERKVSFMNPERERNFHAFYDGDMLVGFVNILEEETEVFIGIGVAPDCCDKGYGRQILKEAYGISKTLYPSKPLYLEVRTWNRRAISCYLQAGFQIDGGPYELETGAGKGIFYRMTRK